MMLSHYMVSMWFVALALQGAFDTFKNPLAAWQAFSAPPPKTYRLRKPRKPPDPYITRIHGAWLRQFHTDNVFHTKSLNCLVVTTLANATDFPFIPDFSFGSCTPCKDFCSCQAVPASPVSSSCPPDLDDSSLESCTQCQDCAPAGGSVPFSCGPPDHDDPFRFNASAWFQDTDEPFATSDTEEVSPVFSANVGQIDLDSDGRVLFQVPRPFEAPSPPVLEANVSLIGLDLAGRVLSQVPRAFQAASKVHSLLIDSGASCCISHELSDFVSAVTPYAQPRVLGGLANGIAIEGVGQVEWTVMTDDGQYRVLRLFACYVPKAGRRLLSPQHCDQQTPSTACWFGVNGQLGRLTMTDNGATITCALDTQTNLPILGVLSGPVTQTRLTELNLCITDENNQNLSASQKELLRWHFRLGHLNFRAVQHLLRTGALGRTRLQTSAANCPHPKCSSCQYGKAHRRPTSTSISQPVLTKEGALKKEDLFPGQRVSIDHFVCSTKGRLYESRGRSRDDVLYAGGMIFVDHASGHVHVEMQVALNASESIAAKQRYERSMLSLGVTVIAYHADNGIFAAHAFVQELHDHFQTAGYSGVGAPHQNGVAERNIGTIMSMARTMMLHAAVRWPDVADSTLWPMAVDYAVHIFNHVPNGVSGISPIELMTRTVLPSKDFVHLHVWGSPAYVLDPTLQKGQKIPKWKPRSRRAIFVGLSKLHAATIPLVLNTTTLAISAQFHVIFDDWFTTVLSSTEEDDVPDWWENLFDTRFQYHFDDGDPIRLDDSWLDEQELAHRRHEEQKKRIVPPPNPDSHVPPAPPPISAGPVRSPTGAPYSPAPAGARPVPVSAGVPPARPSEGVTPRWPPDGVTPPPHPEGVTPTQHSEGVTPPRPSERAPNPLPARARSAPDRLTYDRLGGNNADLTDYMVNCCSAITALPELNAQVAAYRDFLRLDPDTGEMDPCSDARAYAASKTDPDTMRYHEAMMSPDSDGFRDAMQVEIKALERIGTWNIVKRDPSQNVLPGTWAFKRKRYPDGRVRKLKARFCVRGDKQVEGVDYFESYAPVVQWSTVRVILIATMMFGLQTRQVDFNNAFAQATLKEEVYVDLPRGYASDADDCVLKLNKSLYGLVQAPKAFYDHMRSGLEARGFRVSENDPCLFIHDDMLAISWVDDVVIVSRDATKIESMIQNLKDDGYDLDSEGEISAFLGIQVDQDIPNGTFTLTQEGLTQKVIDYTGLADCNPNKIPASTTTLGSDKDGARWVDADEPFEYAAAVGMLMYLANNTRPDIAFAVHQCARFTHAPRQSHGKALKTIIRYLQGTKDKGLIFKPTNELVVDMYVDSDFLGLWRQEDDQDPICVKSRTGYVLELAGCPLSWTSKLQTEIAMSTMEAEYVACSQAMRELIPVRRLVKEVALNLDPKSVTSCRTYSKVFEDNNGALKMAHCPRLTLRNRHIAVKYHWFRSHVTNGDVQVLKVESASQKADCFTKGLGHDLFVRIRKLIMGW
jgi:hypothetical protein